VEETLEKYPELATLIYHPQVAVEAKKDTVNKVFGSQVEDAVRKFLLLLIDKRRESALPAIIKEYQALANQDQNVTEAEVITALPLAEGELQAIAAKLGDMTGKKVKLATKIDQRIVGGVIVKIGDKLIDGSVTRQLKMLQAALLKTEVTKIGVTY
jgi:F-type H+-transporting ATPase subunit delta